MAAVLLAAILLTKGISAQETEQTPPQTQTAPPPAQTPQPAPANRTAPPAQTPPAARTAPPPQAPQTAPANRTTPSPASQPLSTNALQNYRVGRDLETRGRVDEARTYYNEAIRICQAELSGNAANMDAYTVLTWALLRQGRYGEVVSQGDRALRINAGDYRIVETMGEAYFYLNDYSRSLAAFQRYVNAVPRGERASTAYFFMGEIFRNQRKFHHADIAYTTAVQLERSIALWWFQLGSVRESAGEFSSAVPAYEQALALNPSNREASEGLERSRRQAQSAAAAARPEA